MQNNFFEKIKSKNTFPMKVGDYYFVDSALLEDGAVQIYYRNENYEFGYFTITIYNYGAPIPNNLDDLNLLSEYEACKNVFTLMEKKQLYKNVKIIIDEPFSLTNSKNPEFLSCILTYLHKTKDGEYFEELSVLYLRADNGYFHKIRFSTLLSEVENSIDKIGIFLRGWLNFINKL